VDELTAKHRVPGSMLGLDVREPSVATLASTESTLYALEQRDVVAALDEFGAGPSNLALLQRLAITGLKLAPGLVAVLGTAPAATDAMSTDSDDDARVEREGVALVRGLIGLGGALDLTVVAQGIQTQAQVEVLRALGCEYGQGPILGHTSFAHVAPEVGPDHPPAPQQDAAAPPTETEAAPQAESLWATGTGPASPSTEAGGTHPTFTA
jgi:diguanylate cyclase